MPVFRHALLRLGVGLLMALAGPPLAQTQTASEAAVKAGFVYNFAKFTEWPPSGLGLGAPLVLCLSGTDPGGVFTRVVEGRALQGHTIAVRRGVRGEDWRHCQIAYLGDLDERRLSEALRVLRGQPVLTVADAEGFIELGGMIGLVAEGDRFQFEVNADAAQAAGLKISSQLLRLARQVKGRT